MADSRGMRAKRMLAALAVVLFVLVLIIVIRTAAGGRKKFAAAPATPIVFDAQKAIQRYAGAIRIQTVSEPLQPPNAEAMTAFGSYLEQSFPLTHAALKREVVHTGALLYTWQGSDSALAPVVFMGHMDVVPVDPASAAKWTHAPVFW